jgi:hypothetical protein
LFVGEPRVTRAGVKALRYLAAMCAWACAGASDDVSAPDGAESLAPEAGSAWARIGAGERSYAPLLDGAAVPIVLGPQGGYMIAVGVQAGAIVAGDPHDASEPTNPRVTYRALRQSDGRVLGVTTRKQGMRALGDATFEQSGTWLIFDPALDTASYFDTQIRLEVIVVDELARTASDDVVIIAAAPQSAHLEIEPAEVVRRARHDAEHTAGEVERAQQQAVTRLGGDLGTRHLEALLERRVALVTWRAVLGREELDLASRVDQVQLVAHDDVRIVGARDVPEHAAGERLVHRVDPLDQRTGAQQEVIVVRDLVSQLGHPEAAEIVGLCRATLEEEPMPAAPLEGVVGAHDEVVGQVAASARHDGIAAISGSPARIGARGIAEIAPITVATAHQTTDRDPADQPAHGWTLT